MVEFEGKGLVKFIITLSLYPCFGLSKIGFTPPSQLYVVVDLEIGSEHCIAADFCLGSENCIVADPEIGTKNCIAVDQEIGNKTVSLSISISK